MASPTKDVLDGAVGSTAMKTPVRCATTANITLSGFQIIDVVTLADGDENLRVFVKNQTDTTENGLYDAQSGDWTRCQDFDGNRDVAKGTLIRINEGTVSATHVYAVTTSDPIVIGTSSLSFTRVPELGGASIAESIVSADPKTTPIDADLIGLVDSADSNLLKQLSLANIKATLLTYFSTLFTRKVNSIQNLRDSSYLLGDIYVRYHTTSGDGGHGKFRYVSGAGAGTYVDNNGTIIVPTGGDGSAAWLRVINDAITAAMFGVVPGVTDWTTEVQAAIDYANSVGPAQVWFTTPGTYYMQNVAAKNNVKVCAVFGAVVLKVPDGVDKQIFYNENAAVPTTVDYFGMEGLILDGNKSNALGVTATSACAINCVTYLYAKDCIFRNSTGYGLAFQAYPGGSLTGVQTQIYLENVHVLSNGDGVGGDTFDGLDIKDCDIVTLVGVVASGNSDMGINIRGEKVTILGGYSDSNGTYGYGFQGNNNGEAVATTITVNGAEARSNGNAGFMVADGFATPTQTVRVMLNGVKSSLNEFGIAALSGSDKVELSVSGGNCSSNTSHGVSLDDSLQACIISGLICRSNTGSGIYSNGANAQIDSCTLTLNTRYGVEEGAAGTGTMIGGATHVLSNTLGNWLMNSNNRYSIGRAVVDYAPGSGDVIASAATITLPEGGEVYFITGTTNISTVTASRRGRMITLQFSGVLTVDEGPGNLALAGDFVTSSADTMTLVCDGTNWLEVSRSAN